jgi:hypothetical protein
MTDVTVRLDDAIRLVSAVLALTQYPAKVQAEQPHGSHAHARMTQRQFKAYEDHEAVRGMQALLDNGAPLEAMFTLVAHLPWPSLEINTLPKWVPPNWNKHLRDFYETTKIADWWQEESTAWDDAMSESTKMFEDAAFKTFLTQFVGEIKEDLIFMPNVSYPSNQDIGMRVGNRELVAICPPRLAWGDSAPWPYGEDRPYIHRVTLAQYMRLTLVPYLRQHPDVVSESAKMNLPVEDRFRAKYPTWGEQFVNMFLMATTAIYLETLDEREARAYVQNKVKIDGVKILPGAVSVLNRYLQERKSGKFEELADYLPVFPKQLKVAKRIISI